MVLDSGAVTRLAERSQRAAARIAALRDRGLWPPVVLSPVLVECLHGAGTTDASVNRLLDACQVVEEVPEVLARWAAYLRTRARTGSAIDALVVASADPGGVVLTSDPSDLGALAGEATDVRVERV